METDDSDIGAGGNRLTRPVERCGGDKRHIAIGNDEIIETAFEGGACGKNRVAGALAFRLQESFDLNALHACGRGDIVGIAPDHQRHRADARSSHRLHHMRDHRTPGDRMQHLGLRRFHARAVARCENNG
ncbi:hypothetical protein D3C72_1033330 [compost metagenome]